MSTAPANILLIQSDQQRRDSLGCYGNEVVRTPTIDRLAADGVTFDAAFTPCPLCAPARASLITGLRPTRHGILFNPESGSVAGRDFIDRPPALAEPLNAAGYRCHLSGKWHVGTDLPPSACGFDGVFYPGYGYPAEHPHYLEYIEQFGVGFELRDAIHGVRPTGERGPLLAAIQQGPEEVSVPHYMGTQAIESMREAVAAGRPFCQRVDFWGPHVPYIIPRRYARMYDPKGIPQWPNFADDLSGKPSAQRAMRQYWGVGDFTWQQWSHLVAMCYGYVTLIDDQVARLLAAMDELGVAANTAVFYTSDHGGMVGGHGLCDKGPHLYDEICRIPLIARLPDSTGGRRCEAIVYNMDLMPTILELTGSPVPDGLDAASLMPVLTGGQTRVGEADLAYVEFHGHQVPYAQRMIRSKRAKYIFNAPEFDELYDLESDPAEMNNLTADHCDSPRLEQFQSLLEQQLIETGDPLLRYFRCQRRGELSL